MQSCSFLYAARCRYKGRLYSRTINIERIFSAQRILPVDKSEQIAYNKRNITKLAVKRRVSFRIEPCQRAPRVERGRKQGAENGLGAARVKSKSAKPATGAPVTASGCKRFYTKRRSSEAVPRKGTANQGGTAEVMLPPLQWVYPGRGGSF